MGIPVVVSECVAGYLVTAYPQTVALAAQSTPVFGIEEWQWRMASVPFGSTAATGVNGGFVDGVSSAQAPSFSADVAGTYSMTVKARNVSGWSYEVTVEMLVATSPTASITTAQTTANAAVAAAATAQTTANAYRGLLTSVADLAALAALAATGLAAGTRVFVVSVNDTYTLTSGIYVADGLEVIAAAGTTMYWIADLAGRWDDLQGDVSQGTGAAALTYEAYRDTPFMMYFFRHNQNDSLSMRFQFPHGVDKTCAVIPHLHVIPMSAPGAAQNIRLVGQYAWAPAGVACPANVGWTAFGPLIVPFSAADQFKETIVDLVASAAVPGGFKGSDILFVHVRRNGTDATDTYNTGKVGGTAAANIGLASLDVHYRKATQGSVTVLPV